MFPSLNELIGWQSGIDTILPKSTILLGESNPVDTLPFIYSFMNFWLKTTTAAPSQTTTVNTAIIFVAFKSAQNRINTLFRKLYGIQLNLLAAQSKFAFIDAVNGNYDQVLESFTDALKRTEKSRTLVILEGFSWSIANGNHSIFINLFSKIQSLSSFYNTNLFIQWSRDLEEDYPGRNPVLIEDVRLGGAGWLYLLNNCHYVFCVRPLKSGMTRDASGEIIAALGPLMQDVQVKPSFHPVLTLFKIPTDNSIQCFKKGNL
jgi:hypothetical protein